MLVFHSGSWLIWSFQSGVCKHEGVRLRVLDGFVKHRRVHCNCSTLFRFLGTLDNSFQAARLTNQGLEEADKLRAEGNEFFNSGEFETARQRYYGAIWHLDFDIGQQWNLMDKHQLDLNTRRLDISHSTR